MRQSTLAWPVVAVVLSLWITVVGMLSPQPVLRMPQLADSNETFCYADLHLSSLMCFLFHSPYLGAVIDAFFERVSPEEPLPDSCQKIREGIIYCPPQHLRWQ